MPSTVQVSDAVKSELDAIKERDEHTSYDSVIRTLLLRADELESDE